MQVDDFVMVQTPGAVWGKWNIAREINVFPGHDTRVCRIKVKTLTGEYENPITKIAEIYPVEGYEHNV